MKPPQDKGPEFPGRWNSSQLSVFVLFPIVIKYPDKCNLRGKEFIWLIIPGLLCGEVKRAET